jgi:hypothetical protein
MAKRIEVTNCNLPAKERALQARSGYHFINHLQAGRDERKPKIPDRKGTRTITKNAKNPHRIKCDFSPSGIEHETRTVFQWPSRLASQRRPP